MKKKLAATLSGGAVLVLALSGCSNGNKDLDAWAKSVCDSVQPQARKIGSANAAIQQQTSDTSKPEDVQKTDAQAFQDMSDAYEAIGSAVGKAGAPPVDGGDKKQKDAVKELKDTAASYADLKKQVDGLDTKDQAKFADGLNDIATSLDKLGKNGNDALAKLEEGDVGKSMGRQKTCQKVSATPTAGT
ncbi:hypothetical protein GCM10018793_53000 [Streptomyces sulfonofaciens]|uniref:Small secreted protein n=1 Tax=Streptomyces sulfonofaciens TaxID=68272 RepID=A0A919L652_9ACTN|nr:small secreted protein [Streptomyces sulfonofaciens]GHH85363.1 hypothetical protein GCM10018793_53000 [Streptomyces sulfonofaciens]